MEGMYLNEFHKQQSLKAAKIISEMPRMSSEEVMEQYKSLKRQRQKQLLKEEKDSEK